MEIKKSEIVFILIMVVLFVGFYFGIYKPQQRALVILNEELSQNTAKFETLKLNQGNISEYVKKNIDLKLKIKSLKNRFVTKEELGDVISLLTNLINDNKIKSNSISFLPTVSGKSFDNIGINLNASGAKGNIERFLLQIENFEKDISIENVSINSSKDGELSLVLGLKLYLQKEEEQGSVDPKETSPKDVTPEPGQDLGDKAKENTTNQDKTVNESQKSDSIESKVKEGIEKNLEGNELLNLFNER